LIIVICGYLFGWKWTGLPKRTLWDWMALLIVPAVLAVGGYLLTQAETQRTQRDSDQQRRLDRELADQRAQDAALQAYLDGMSHLLTDKDLRSAPPGDSLSSVARARTLTVLKRLDSGRKQSVLQFLYESGLIYKEHALIAEIERHNTVSLQQADLSGADLIRANLHQADLSETSLMGANLMGANLTGAKGWTYAQLRAAKSLEGATMPDGKILGGEAYPDGPTFDEWVKDREGHKEAGENE